MKEEERKKGEKSFFFFKIKTDRQTDKSQPSVFLNRHTPVLFYQLPSCWCIQPTVICKEKLNIVPLPSLTH